MIVRLKTVQFNESVNNNEFSSLVALVKNHLGGPNGVWRCQTGQGNMFWNYPVGVAGRELNPSSTSSSKTDQPVHAS